MVNLLKPSESLGNESNISLIIEMAYSRSFPHWGFTLGITFKFLLIVGLKLIIAYCSYTKDNWGIVI